MHQHLAVVRLLDEVIQHLLGDFEVGDDAVFHRFDGDDVARRAAEHLFRFFADRLHFPGILIQRDNGRFVDNNAFSFGIDKRIRGPEIDGKVRRKEAEKGAKIHV